jgi:hypothetical protein
MATVDQISDFVRRMRVGQLAWSGVPYLGYEMTVGEPWAVKVEQLGRHLEVAAAAESLSLANALSSPNAELIEQAVAMVIPPVYSGEFSLWVQAMQWAAEQQHVAGKQRAGNFALALVVLALVFAGFAMFASNE